MCSVVSLRIVNQFLISWVKLVKAVYTCRLKPAKSPKIGRFLLKIGEYALNFG